MAGAGVQGQESIGVLFEKVVKRGELKLSNGTGKEIRQNKRSMQLLVNVEWTTRDRSIMVINIIIRERTADINTELFCLWLVFFL